MRLQKTGMEKSKADPCVFRKVVDEEVTLIVCAHVDDLAVTGKGQRAVRCFMCAMKEGFSCE